MTQEWFAVGDTHGCLERLENLLQNWSPDNQRLVILGDLIDRGPDGLGVVRLAMKLQKDYGAVIVGGNHEDLFLNFLEEPTEEASTYYFQGGRETIRSFFNGDDIAMRFLPETVANRIKEEFPDEIKFLYSLPHYHETEKYVFVHAGVDLDIGDWRNTRPIDFRWIRGRFHHGLNETGKTFIFGHTPTRLLNADRNDGLWISNCKTKMGIDGGAVFGGLLIGLHLKENGFDVYTA